MGLILIQTTPLGYEVFLRAILRARRSEMVSIVSIFPEHEKIDLKYKTQERKNTYVLTKNNINRDE